MPNGPCQPGAACRKELRTLLLVAANVGVVGLDGPNQAADRTSVSVEREENWLVQEELGELPIGELAASEAFESWQVNNVDAGP